MTLLCLCCFGKANAYDFETDGIYYNILSDSTCAVTGLYDPTGMMWGDNSSAYVGDVVIPDSVMCYGDTYVVTEIGSYAFFQCSSLTSVTTPKTLKRIAEMAFDTSSLRSVRLHDGLVSIGEYAFQYCESLTSIDIPKTVSTIESSAFSGCSKLKTVVLPKQLTEISDHLFFACSSLTTVDIPESVKIIDQHAFNGCSSLETLDLPEEMTTLAYGAFWNCTSITAARIPQGIKSVSNCFSGCTSLATIDIPEGVTSMNGTFDGCVSLTAVSLPNSIQKLSWTFSGCKGLTKMQLPESVQTLDGTFKNCTGLTEVYIPASVTSLSADCFSGCTNLSAITVDEENDTYVSVDGIVYDKDITMLVCQPGAVDSVKLPSGITLIGDGAFANSNITAIELPASVVTIGEKAFENCVNLKQIQLSANLKSIGCSAFSGCTALENIILPESLISLGSSVFYKCSSLRSIVLPDALTEIGKDVFSACTNLTSVVFPNGIKTIEESMFSSCQSLTHIDIPQTVETIEDKAFRGTGLVEIILPESVRSIGYGVFLVCDSLKSVILPDGLTEIGAEAFCSCDSLTHVSIPNSVTEIKSGTFDACPNLRSVSLPDSLKYIRGYAFEGCRSLESIHIPNTVESIGRGAFAYCKSLTSVTIPNSVTEIGMEAFENCDSLSEVNIPESVTTLPFAIFMGCESLKSFYVHDKMKSIDSHAFGYTGLTSITLPASLESLGDYAFSGCLDLKEVRCKSEKPATIPWEFEIVSPFADLDLSDVVLYVIAGSKSAYENAKCWNEFQNIVEFGGTYKVTYIVDGEEYKTVSVVQDEVIPTEEEPVKDGHTFSGWSEVPATMPAEDVTITGSFSINTYKVTYVVDDEEYKSIDVVFGETVPTEKAPTKEGYTFSGWREVPATMPAEDVTITGIFTINTYKVTYVVDGEEYKSVDVVFGETVPTEKAPTKEGYTFSGWREVPATMPAEDVTITGTFVINTYKVTYVVDGEEYKVFDVVFGETIPTEKAATKEGYTFSGWSEFPATMPANDVTITGTFSINTYKVTYVVDGEEYKSVDVVFGEAVPAEEAPTKEGHTFSGWSEVPATMPANDVTITGTFAINTYKVTYVVDGEEYKSLDVVFGEAVPAEEAPTKDGYEFSGWSEIPETMPAEDITVTGSFSKIDGIICVSADTRVDVYNLNGMKVASKIAVKDLKTELEDGIYIINGRQYLIK